MASLTAEIGKFLEGISYDDLPAEVLPMVRDAFTDTVGVVMVGIEEPVANIVRKTLVEPAARGEARACLSSHLVSAPEAALLAGAIAHSLDYDDQSMSGHPSAVLVPAILAEAETLGSTGKEAVTAYVAGYEVWCELWRRSRNYHAKGWHPTSVFGVMAAAAAGAVLHKLSAERAATAVAIAGSFAGGLFSNFGSMMKGYHAGQAARGGLEAARLAAAGMSAGHDAIENVQGFLVAFSPDAQPDLESESKLGKEWYLPKHKLLIKLHPTCYFLHRSFNGTVKLLAENTDIAPDDIASVEVHMGRGQVTCLVYERPQTRWEAEFSGQYGIAAAVLLGKLGVPETADEVVQRPDMQAFLPKVKLTAVDEFDPRDPVFSPSETVTLTLNDGRVIKSDPITTIPGGANDPLSAEQLWTKFQECTLLTHNEADARILFDQLQRIDSLESMSELPTCTGIFKD
ncbi:MULTISPECIES: MmgE/PrpD family protein [unclassified Microbacterium]|uniref:MmgE/PrpD family protein n=1 Tax=unclassified Microbacterium TaxID=2609290 RepID=UPI00214C8987|nr:MULTISPECIES: MmgE/PrpD family protein [unclassified Microbacterium]MCR2811386.1 MmgE/PrpD family protein [Microbacterium sp. zg.B185]WIM19568.1 MmgE/PrpD family protein [Microbacterium sp. zg-B185]